MVDSVTARGPIPLAAKQAHIITSPQLCLTVGTRGLHSCVVFTTVALQQGSSWFKSWQGPFCVCSLRVCCFWVLWLSPAPKTC